MVGPDPTPTAENTPPAGSEWGLAPGVWPVEGFAIGTPRPEPAHVYTLVRPDGRRFQVSESLYRLAELLEARQSLTAIAAELSGRLGRPLGADDVDRLIREKLLPWAVVAPR